MALAWSLPCGKYLENTKDPLCSHPARVHNQWLFRNRMSMIHYPSYYQQYSDSHLLSFLRIQPFSTFYVVYFTVLLIHERPVMRGTAGPSMAWPRTPTADVCPTGYSPTSTELSWTGQGRTRAQGHAIG